MEEFEPELAAPITGRPLAARGAVVDEAATRPAAEFGFGRIAAYLARDPIGFGPLRFVWRLALVLEADVGGELITAGIATCDRGGPVRRAAISHHGQFSLFAG